MAWADLMSEMPDTYNDIDFCLRIRETGYRIVWTPEAELYHDGPLAEQLGRSRSRSGIF